MSVLQKLTEGVIHRDLGREGQALLTKWEKTGLLEGLSGDRARNTMAVLLENQAKELLREASSMAAGDVEGFAAVAFPIVRRVFGGLIANDLVSVQPMSLPSGLIFFLDFTHEGGRAGFGAGASLYGGGVVGRQIVDGVTDIADTGFYNLHAGYAAATGSFTQAMGATLAKKTAIVNGSTEHKALDYDPDVVGKVLLTVSPVAAATGTYVGQVDPGMPQSITFDSSAGMDIGVTVAANIAVVANPDNPAEILIAGAGNGGNANDLQTGQTGAGDLNVAKLRIVRRLTSVVKDNSSGDGLGKLTRVSRLVLEPIAVVTHPHGTAPEAAFVNLKAADGNSCTLNNASATPAQVAAVFSGAATVDRTSTVTATNMADIIAGLGTVTLKMSAPSRDNLKDSDNALGAVVGADVWGLEEPAPGTGNAGSTVGKNLIPEIDIKVDSVAVTAQTKKLKAKWSPELGQDLNAYHNLDAEVELTGILSEQIALEIDQEILTELVRGGKAGTLHWSRRPGQFLNRFDGTKITSADAPPDFTGTVSEWYETLVETINDVSAQIHRKTLRGGANFLVCGPEVANILEFTSGFRASVTHDDDKGTVGAVKAGSISKKWDLYVDPYFFRNLILVGRKGGSFLESGFVYAPYVPLQVTPTIFGTEDFVPRKGVMTRYAKKMVRPDLYGLVIVQDLVG